MRCNVHCEEEKMVNVENNFLNSNLVALRTRLCENKSEKYACRMFA